MIKFFRRIFRTKDKYINQKRQRMINEMIWTDEELNVNDDFLRKKMILENDAKMMLIDDFTKKLKERYYGK